MQTFSAIDGLVSRVSAVQMKAIVPDATDLKKFGLDKPAEPFDSGSGSSQATLAWERPLEIGQRLRERSVPARGLHHRFVALLTISKKDAVGVPAEGSVRRAVFQHDAA